MIYLLLIPLVLLFLLFVNISIVLKIIAGFFGIIFLIAIICPIIDHQSLK
uniref:Uncharacterized protein n=1 Tax=Siphoviridae sp. ctHjK2 TaxID=2827831 RepID=A0A8S5SQQ3_9CAUD|nr:MAG TPA: hypothetical protein [Siphoviridae sp. ctHjK2]